MVLNPDFEEFIQLLNANSVHYLIVGGYAVAFHGHPRYTKDIDIWVLLDIQNAKKLMTALEQFGFGSVGLQVEDFLKPNQIVQLGHPPNRIDILTGIDGVDFETCYKNKVIATIDDTPINFIDLEHLKQNKRASGRLQDMADIESLE